MIFYGNPSTVAIRQSMTERKLGCITTPKQHNKIQEKWDVIADNGCFSGAWQHDRWLAYLDKLERSQIRFVVAPDVFVDGQECHNQTLEKWHIHKDEITSLGFQPAFVCQQGATTDSLPDANFYFIGGSTDFKLGKGLLIAKDLSDQGKWVHMGRVNSLKRLRLAKSVGCKSADGTYLVFGPNRNLPKLLSWVGEVNSQYSIPF